MICLWCDFEAPPRGIHSHLLDQHAERVVAETDDSGLAYNADCPECDTRVGQAISGRLTEPSLLEELEPNVRLVVFDMLINHYLVEHTEREVVLPEVRTHGGSDDRST